MNHGVRYLSIAFVRNPTQIYFKNSVYVLEKAELLKFPVIKSLVYVHRIELLCVLSKIDDDTMVTLNIQKHIPHTLKVIKIDNASSSHVGRITMISDVYQDTSIMFGNKSLKRRKTEKQNTVATTNSVRTGKAPLVESVNEPTVDPMNAENPASKQPILRRPWMILWSWNQVERKFKERKRRLLMTCSEVP